MNAGTSAHYRAVKQQEVLKPGHCDLGVVERLFLHLICVHAEHSAIPLSLPAPISVQETRDSGWQERRQKQKIGKKRKLDRTNDKKEARK